MRRFGLLILSLIVGLSPSVSRGGNYPDRPIRLVVGFGVGGPTDIPARFIADKLSEALEPTCLCRDQAGLGRHCRHA